MMSEWTLAGVMAVILGATILGGALLAATILGKKTD